MTARTVRSAVGSRIRRGELTLTQSTPNQHHDSIKIYISQRGVILHSLFTYRYPGEKNMTPRQMSVFLAPRYRGALRRSAQRWLAREEGADAPRSLSPAITHTAMRSGIDRRLSARPSRTQLQRALLLLHTHSAPRCVAHPHTQWPCSFPRARTRPPHTAAPPRHSPRPRRMCCSHG